MAIRHLMASMAREGRGRMPEKSDVFHPASHPQNSRSPLGDSQ